MIQPFPAHPIKARAAVQYDMSGLDKQTKRFADRTKLAELAVSNLSDGPHAEPEED